MLVESLNQLLKYDIQFVILGVGEQHYINRFKYLKEKHPDKEGGSLINVFVIDSKNRKLNSVDLWFINHKNEDLETNIKQREKEIYWNKIKKL